MQEEQLIDDWNSRGIRISRSAAFAGETLRDRVPPPSVRTPPIEVKLRILHLMQAPEIESADVGLPGAGAQESSKVARLASEIGLQPTQIPPCGTAATFVAGIRPEVKIIQRTGRSIPAAFVGTSAIRQDREGNANLS